MNHEKDCSSEDCALIESVEATSKLIAQPQPPWLEPGDLVRLVDDGRLSVVVCVERGYFGTIHRVRTLDDGSEYELTRDDLVFESA